MYVQRRSCSVLETDEQKPKLLKNQVQMFRSHAAFPREINSWVEGGKRWHPSTQTLQKMSEEMLLQGMEWGVLAEREA